MPVIERADQHLIALSAGQANRMGRAEVMRALRDREIDPAMLILSPPPCLESMFTFDLLRRVPRVGRTTIREINRRAICDRINLAVSLGELTGMRRRWLVAQLAHRETEGRRGPLPLANRPQG